LTVEGHTYEPLAPHGPMVDAFTSACELIGRPFLADPDAGTPAGSTDMGNVTQRLPAIHPLMTVHSLPAVNHQPEFARHCTTEAADRCLLDGAKAMAITALEIAADPSLLPRAA
jgi:metal-dependent amidase/aminoacylase/carboxypeptidase family protein